MFPFTVLYDDEHSRLEVQFQLSLSPHEQELAPGHQHSSLDDAVQCHLGQREQSFQQGQELSDALQDTLLRQTTVLSPLLLQEVLVPPQSLPVLLLESFVVSLHDLHPFLVLVPERLQVASLHL